MATKKTYVTVTLPPGVAAFAHLYKADDKAPDGASWKPDGKIKTSLVYDDASVLDEVREAILKKLRADYPGVQDDDFKLPLAEYPEDGKLADLRGKTIVIAKTQPDRWLTNGTPGAGKIVDSKNRNLPKGVEVRSGDLIRIRATVNAYEKTEKVKIKGKIVDETVYGANLWLNGVQLIDKRASGSGGGFDEYDGGYDSSEASDGFASGDTAAAADDENADF